MKASIKSRIIIALPGLNELHGFNAAECLQKSFCYPCLFFEGAEGFVFLLHSTLYLKVGEETERTR